MHAGLLLLAAVAGLAQPAAVPGLAGRIEALPVLLAEPVGDAFAPAFHQAVTPAQWAAMQAQVGAGAGRPLAILRADVTAPTQASVVVRFERAAIGVRLSVEPAAPWRISGLRIMGAVAPEATVAEVLGAVAALPGQAALAVARLGPGAPVLLHAVDADRVLSVGSAFKLVVLAELVRAVTAGERRWDDALALDGTPLPGGAYAALPAGTAVPLRRLAHDMIAASDNGATDILLGTLGRGRVEAMLPVVGIARPEGMRPFLSTMEAFKLKAAIAAGDTAWLRADEPGRRALLAGPVAATPLDGRAFVGHPLSIEAVEWRAAPADMVRVLDWLRRQTASGPGAEARAILAANPGIGPDGAEGWRFVGYKGGSEPGVIAMGLLLQRPAGEWLAVFAAWNDPAGPVDELRFAALIGRLAGLLLPAD